MSTENNNQTNDSEWRKREMGALWKKVGRNQTFLSGQIKLKASDGSEELVRIIVFNNKNKKSDNAPDFVIYKSEDRREQSSEDSDATEKETVEADGLL
jgi:hypothetical protein